MRWHTLPNDPIPQQVRRQCRDCGKVLKNPKYQYRCGECWAKRSDVYCGLDYGKDYRAPNRV